MRVISQSMAEKVKSIQQADLEYVLKGLNLSTEEINSAWKRVKKVKELIKNAKVYDGKEKVSHDTILIVPDDNWNDIAYDKLCSSGSEKVDTSNKDNNLYDIVKYAHQETEPLAKINESMRKR